MGKAPENKRTESEQKDSSVRKAAGSKGTARVWGELMERQISQTITKVIEEGPVRKTPTTQAV